MASASECWSVMQPEPPPANDAVKEGGAALDYESPPQRRRGILGLLRVRHDEPLTGRHVLIVLAALVMLGMFFWVMASLFPHG